MIRHPFQTIKFWLTLIVCRRNENRTLKELRSSICATGVWFIDIPRTSSTSIREQLGSAYEKSYLRESGAKRKYKLPDHMHYQEADRFMQDYGGLGSLGVLSIVRNPFDRIVSIWRYRQANKEIPQIDFNDFAHELETPRFKDRNHLASSRHFRMTQCDFLRQQNGTIEVDLLGHFEKREQFLENVQNRYGITLESSVRQECLNSTQESFRTYYNQRAVDAVKRYFQEDLDHFGYSFD